MDRRCADNNKNNNNKSLKGFLCVQSKLDLLIFPPPGPARGPRSPRAKGQTSQQHSHNRSLTCFSEECV